MGTEFIIMLLLVGLFGFSMGMHTGYVLRKEQDK